MKENKTYHPLSIKNTKWDGMSFAKLCNIHMF